MAGGVTGNHVVGEGGWVADDNARDNALIAHATALTGKADLESPEFTGAPAVNAEPVVSAKGLNVQGAWDDGTALASLLTALEAYGMIVDSTTPTTVVTGSAPEWQASQVTPGTVGVVYSFFYYASGSPACTYAVTLGSLPPGLTLNGTTGELAGTPTTAGAYTFTVTASNGVAPATTRERVLSIAAAAVPTGTIYGPKVVFDTKSNIPITASQKLGYMFKAHASANLNAIRFTQRSGPGGQYSLGNFGTMTVTVRPDSGGVPHASTVLATLSFTPSGSNSVHTEIMDLKTFGSPAALTAGTKYWIVFSGSSDSNFLSVNLIFSYANSQVVPRQPGFSDADIGMIYTSGAWGGLDPGHTPVMDLVYSNGVVGGQSYYEAEVAMYTTISGTGQMARERFTVSGGDRIVSGAKFRVRRSTGTSPLILALWTVNPTTGALVTLVDSVSVAAANVRVSAAGSDNGGSDLVGGNFSANRTLTNGETYALVASTASGTTYTAMPIRQGIDMGYQTPDGFTDGEAERATTGSNWAAVYAYGSLNYQCHFPIV